MKPVELKVARIGNSRGVRLPASTLARFGIGDSVFMEEQSDGIRLRPVKSGPPKLSWTATAAAMADEHEDWSAWDATLADGLESIPWDDTPAKRVVEPGSKRAAKKVAKKNVRTGKK